MTSKPITVSAPGKIHFLGEHTAVYFKPAILAAIDKRCTVDLIPTQSKDIKIISKNFYKSITLSVGEILKITDKAQRQWEEYRGKNDISILKAIVTDEMTYPVIAIGETLKHFEKTSPKGFQLTIDSKIPIGSGHGSSAAVAASIAGAVSKFLGESTEKDVIGNIAIRVEQKKHGNPSYGDVGAVVNGGLIWFRKETPDVVIVQSVAFSVPTKISKNLMVIQSGVPVESTGEIVHDVALLKKKKPEVFDRVLEEQEQLTRDLLGAIKDADEKALIHILRAGEKNLETIGVVSPSASALIREIEKSGGAAKICGAGGKTKGSGIILAYHKDKKVIESLAKAQHLPYYAVALGGEGLRIEKSREI